MLFLRDLKNKKQTPLVYPKTNQFGFNQYTNLLLIDSGEINNYQEIVNSVNSSTFYVVYSITSSKTELLFLLQKLFTTIQRIGICFTSSFGNKKIFLDCKPLFNNDGNEYYNENVTFVVNLIKDFNVKNIDFLACNTLNYLNWMNYYTFLTENTGVTVGASNNKTGNIKYGGDWIMETTSEDIEFVYFTKNINYYNYLLDNPSWSSGYYGDFALFKFYGDYLYFPNYVDYDPDNSNKIVQTNLDGNINEYMWALSYNPESCIVHEGYLYVTNAYNDNTIEMSNSISKISLTNPTFDNNHQWIKYDQGLNYPVGLVTDGTYLYVTNFENDTISRVSLINPSGDFIPDWATSDQGLSAPTGIVLNGDFLYVANSHGETISKISLTDPTGSNSIPNWVKGLSYPVGLVINSGYLYVSNAHTNTINQILLSNPSQNNTTWATSAQGLNTPVGIDIKDNYLYVYNNSIGTISQISLPIACFKENTKILTEQGYRSIQDLRKGDLIKTLKHGYLPIDTIGKREIYHNASQNRNKNQLYKCCQDKYSEVFEDLILTGSHSILVNEFTSNEEKQKTIEINGSIYVTDGKYRLPACVDEKTFVYEIPGNYTIYHLALKNNNYYMNYGIYANGLLVETCSKRYLNELSEMELIE